MISYILYIYVHTHTFGPSGPTKFRYFRVFQFDFEHLQFHFNMFMFLGDPLSLEYYTINRK